MNKIISMANMALWHVRAAKYSLVSLTNEESVKIINNTNLFDSDYYLNNNPDVAKSGINPLIHFILHGGIEGRNPSADFNSKYYLSQNADVREMNVNPLVHYILVGESEGRTTSPSFVTSKNKRRIPKKLKRVDIINVNFYDWEGKTLYKGGAERYVYDLACILLDEGYKPRILQNATKSFKKQYRGIEVIGVETGASDAAGSSLRKMSIGFNDYCNDADLVIASPLDLACEITNDNIVGINHGIHWDTKNNHLYNYRASNYSEIFDGLRRVSKGVCVDTNFINWTRTYDYDLGSKLNYIPNYYDKKDFIPTEKDFNDRLRIMYPRRLYEARGIYITIKAFDYLLAKHNDIDLLLVGQTSDNEVKRHVSKLQKKYPKQVTLEEYDMQDMYKAYRKSNIVLIPTLYAEGTSLSAVEAMATNNVLVATNIGGLPNLIIDGYNGLLIDPNTEALVKAIENLVVDRKFVKQLADRGLEVASVFEKDNWNKKWKNIFKELL